MQHKKTIYHSRISPSPTCIPMRSEAKGTIKFDEPVMSVMLKFGEPVMGMMIPSLLVLVKVVLVLIHSVLGWRARERTQK